MFAYMSTYMHICVHNIEFSCQVNFVRFGVLITFQIGFENIAFECILRFFFFN